MDEREKASTTLCGGKQMTRAIEGRLLQSGEAVQIELRAGRVASVTPLQGSPEGLPWLAPGLPPVPGRALVLPNGRHRLPGGHGGPSTCHFRGLQSLS